jgi:hypothetical protein
MNRKRTSESPIRIQPGFNDRELQVHLVNDQRITNGGALQVYLTEFESYRQEIITYISLSRQLVNYSIAFLTGIALIASSGIIKVVPPYLFLIASILASGLSWAIIEAALLVSYVSSYIRFGLVPKIEKLISEETKEEFTFFRLHEHKGTPITVGIKSIFSLGRYVISYLPSIIFIAVFLYYKPFPTQHSWPIQEKVLFWVALIAVFMVPFGGIVRIFSYFFVSIKKRQKK